MQDFAPDLESLEEDASSSKDERSAFLNAQETKAMLARRMVANMREQLDALERLLLAEPESVDMDELMQQNAAGQDGVVAPLTPNARVIEGVFDGQHMVGSDGRQYSVPQNYASKSKLVEGDILKLSIQANGSFLFKQIGPIERERVVGMLIRDEITHEWKVAAAGRKYHVLPSSVSYFKGEPGDNIVILIPKAAPSTWAAVENIVRQE